MPRPHRLQLAGAVQHITARGNRRQRIFEEGLDYETFLVFLGRVCARYRWRVRANCMLPNHYHLILETLEPNLSAGMHLLNSGYAHWFNECHEVDGHLFQGRFGWRLIESERHELESLRYVLLNPVRAGLCRAPEDWPWSSYRATVGAAPRPGYLALDWLVHFGRDTIRAREAFKSFIREGLPNPKP